MIYENEWLFDDKVFTSDDIEDYLGFVYLITNIRKIKKPLELTKGFYKKVREIFMRNYSISF